MFTAPKVILSVVMVGALVAGFTVRPPGAAVPTGELKRLVASVAVLYIVGIIALLVHRSVLAGIVVGVGLLLCALALWLSRGHTPPRDDTGGGEDDGEPPRDPSPTGPELLWDYYEDQFSSENLWADRVPDRVS